MQHDWQFPSTGAGTTTWPGADDSASSGEGTSSGLRSAQPGGSARPGGSAQPGGSARPGTGGAGGEQPSRRSRSSERSHRAAAQRTRRRRSAIALIVALLLVAGGGFVVAQLVLPLFDQSSSAEATPDFPGPGHGRVQVVVNPGDTGAMIGQTLADAGVVATAKGFVSAASASPDSAGIQPGTYSLLLEMKSSDAVRALLDPANRVAQRVTVPEGQTVSQVLERLASVTGVPLADIQAAATDTTAIGLPAEAGGMLEGWLYPATYAFEPGTEPVAMLATMVEQTAAVLTEHGVPEDSRQAVLIKASLVEREAKRDEDRPKVARAIENRLAQGMPLQIDSTVAYGLDKSGADLTRDDLDVPGPYNTYTQTGLPAGPIASPGLTSIEAVLNPAPGSWLFWVTVNLETGETLFSDNYTEHQANVAKLRQWEAEQQ